MLSEYKTEIRKIEIIENGVDIGEYETVEVYIKIIEFYEKFVSDIATNKLKTKKDILDHAKLIYKKMMLEYRD